MRLEGLFNLLAPKSQVNRLGRTSEHIGISNEIGAWNRPAVSNQFYCCDKLIIGTPPSSMKARKEFTLSIYHELVGPESTD